MDGEEVTGDGEADVEAAVGEAEGAVGVVDVGGAGVQGEYLFEFGPQVGRGGDCQSVRQRPGSGRR